MRFYFLAAMLPLAGVAMAQGIYTCVDAKGRKITSDRPITECNDRAQHEITSSGTVKRVLGPTLSAQERAAQDDKEKAEAEARAQQQEEKRRVRALLSRFPNLAAHNRERAASLTQVDEAIVSAVKRVWELAALRKDINNELEFYKKDLSKMPPALRRKLDENDSNLAGQYRFITDQDLEKRRVNQRFDEDLAKLKLLWSTPEPTASLAKKP